MACRVCRRVAGALPTGCACEPRSCHAHVACLLSAGRRTWISCAVCDQEFAGPICKELARVVLKRAKSARPVVDEDVLFAKMYHAYSCALVGETLDAERDLRRCLVVMGERLGANHPLTLQTSGHLCEVLLVLGQSAEAEARSRALFLACVASDTLVQFARSTLARVLRETKKLAEAETLLRACSPSSSTMRSMVILLYRQRRFFEAAEYAVRSLAINAAAYGRKHDETALDASILRKIRRRVGNGDARCATCGAREPKPRLCGACRDARYCGTACQKSHRAAHRGTCRVMSGDRSKVGSVLCRSFCGV